MVSEISSALKEQGVASNEIATHVEKIAQMAENNSNASQETASSAHRMSVLGGEYGRNGKPLSRIAETARG